MNGSLALLAVSLLAAEFKAGDVTYGFSSEGRLVSVRERDTGRELAILDQPWVRTMAAPGRAVWPKAMTRQDDRLSFVFSDGNEIVERVGTFDGGLVFTVEKCTFTSAYEVIIAHLRPSVTNYVGDIACALSDDWSGVCLRGGEFETEMSSARRRLTVSVPGRFSPVGKRAFLTAGPRATFVGKLKKLVVATGLPYSTAGGPWSGDPGVIHGSYLFADVTVDNVDAWIRIARLAGISIIHSYTWEEARGHYLVSPKHFPGRLDDLKRVADKIHAAGLGFSVHTLTGCIDYHDSWARPKAHPDLIARSRYTLAAPVTETSTEILVNEEPTAEHGTAQRPSRYGKILDLGGELVTYREIRRTKPYAFTGIERGWNKTAKFDHPAGSSVKYLQSVNFSFFPDPDSPLAEEMADCIAHDINTIGADMFYLDGSEAMGTSYGTAKMASMIFSRIDHSKRPVQVEMSCHQPHFWPFRAMFEAWDRPSYGHRAFVDSHIASNRRGGFKSNFLKSQMGWWSPTAADAGRRGVFLDEVEYFAGCSAGCDSAISLQGIHPTREGVLPIAVEKALTMLGWYERFRVAGAFAPDVLKLLDTPGAEGRLRQDETGAWTYTPITVVSSRLQGENVGGRGTFEADAAGEVSLRVEAFYGLAVGGGTPTLSDGVVFGASNLDRFKETAAAGVTVSVGRDGVPPPSAKDGVPPPSETAISLSARNANATSRGAWVRLARWEKPPYLNYGNAAGVGFWVKGDGSGAILDVRLSTPGEYYHCDADHVLKLDFTGWRYVQFLFRERDTDVAARLAWDVAEYDRAPFMVKPHPEKIAGVSIWLNEIPPGKGVDIALGEIRALPIQAAEAEDVAVEFNGDEIDVPFDFEAGDYAELEDGVWTLYNERGELKKRAKGARVAVKKGRNAYRLKGDAEDATFRGMVTFFVKGRSIRALKGGAGAGYETMMPQEYAPAKGAIDLQPVRVRPGEKAKLEVTLRGPIADPVLWVEDGVRGADPKWIEIKLPTLGAKQLAVFTDGPVVSGVRRVKMTSSDPMHADAAVDVAKRYGR